MVKCASPRNVKGIISTSMILRPHPHRFVVHAEREAVFRPNVRTTPANAKPDRQRPECAIAEIRW